MLFALMVFWRHPGVLEWKEHGPWGQHFWVASPPSFGLYEIIFENISQSVQKVFTLIRMSVKFSFTLRTNLVMCRTIKI